MELSLHTPIRFYGSVFKHTDNFSLRMLSEADEFCFSSLGRTLHLNQLFLLLGCRSDARVCGLYETRSPK
jgi:hypothetical protein